MTDDLKRLFKEATRVAINSEGTPGVLGRADGVLFFTDPFGEVQRNQAWCRVGGGESQTELVVRCDHVPVQFGLPVIVALRDGVPTAIRTDTVRASEFSGGRSMNVPQHAWSHGRLGPDPLYVTGLSFLPLMAYPNEGLTVNVEGGFYQYGGADKYFPHTVSPSLASLVPTWANGQRIVLVCIDRSTNTLALVDGATSVAPAGVNPFPVGAIAAAVAALPATHAPLAAIRLHAGQTALSGQDIVLDLRRWLGGGANGLADLTDVDFTTPPAAGDFLRYDDALGVWMPATADLGDLGDVTLTGPASGEVLAYDGAGWVNAPAPPATLADMAEATVKGRALGAGTGAPTDLSAAQVAAIVEPSITHNNIVGLTTGDPHTQYLLLAGRSPLQTIDGTVRIGAGTDTVATAGAILEVQQPVTGGIAVRRSDTDVEFALLAASGSGLIGMATNHELRFYVNNNLAGNLLISTAGNIGVGVAAPQGRLHAHDGTGGFIFKSVTGVAGSLVTIVSSAAGGNVQHQFTGIVSIRASDGQQWGDAIHVTATTPYTAGVGGGGGLIQFSIASGALRVQRTAGSNTYTVMVAGVWI